MNIYDAIFLSILSFLIYSYANKYFHHYLLIILITLFTLIIAEWSIIKFVVLLYHIYLFIENYLKM